MKYVVYILLAFSILACGKQDEAVSSGKNPLFARWAATDMDLDLTDGQEGIFEMTVYRVYASNPYRCFVTVELKGNVAQMLYWYQDRAFAGAECRALFEDVAGGTGMLSYQLDVSGDSLSMKAKTVDGNVTLAQTLRKVEQ